MDLDEAQKRLEQALEDDDYLYYEPRDFVDEKNRIHGMLIDKDGYCFTFITEREWGPAVSSATPNGHIDDEDNESWREYLDENSSNQ